MIFKTMEFWESTKFDAHKFFWNHNTCIEVDILFRFISGQNFIDIYIYMYMSSFF